MTDPALLKAVEKVLMWHAGLEGHAMSVSDFVLLHAIRDLRAAYAIATDDPCRLHRDGKLCGTCPYNPICLD